ncbi:MAG TPA: dihydrolipoyl dehydrogenase, partial [candidate division WOR-3 bacterium]|nr:dihydrolipoyl dehydrogenase [candidate division WOR-3 bacterium]
MRVGIVGAGPAGYLAALIGSIKGVEVYLFEKDRVGGVCLNRGCIPVKSLIKTSATINLSKKIRKNGIEFSEPLIDWSKVLLSKERAAKRLVSGVERLLNKRGVFIINGEAKVIHPGTIFANNQEYNVDKIIIATGSKPSNPPFPIPEGVWHSDQALMCDSIPQTIGIIGGGIIGMEFAYIFSSFGSKVAVFEIMDEILCRKDREMASMLRREMEKMGVIFYLGTKVEKIEKKGKGFRVIYDNEGVEKGKEFSNVLIAIGRELNSIGIPDTIEKDGYIKVNKKLETSMQNVYAAGDCIGGYLLAHSAFHEGEIAIKNCMGEEKKIEEEYIPRVVYTRPELAVVGFSEEELKEAHIEYDKAYFPFSANGRAIAENNVVGGIKILFDKQKRLLGASILGGIASEMITLLVNSMKHNLTIDNISETIFPHPTYSEAIKEACSIGIGLPVH